MTIRPFIPWPDKRLRTVCDPVEAVDDHVHAVWRKFDGDFGRDLLGDHFKKHDH